MNRSNHRIFVYGSLMSGEYNHPRLARARLVAQTRTAPGYMLYDLGPFPGLVRGGQQRVSGELYEVDAAGRASLDVLEGHPRFYCRTLIKLEDGGIAEAYMLSNGQVRGRRMIESGCWRGRKDRDL